MMKKYKKLIIILLSSLVVGCHLLGDYVTPGETSTVSKTDLGLCFAVPNAGDYRPATLGIRHRDTPAATGFFREMPALAIHQGELCIPDSYYKFPSNGAFIVEYALRSPTKKRERRFVVTVFKIVNGEPHMLKPRDDEVSLPYTG